MQDQQIDNALLRQYYLQQLGVTVYVPRSASAEDDAPLTVADAVALPEAQPEITRQSNPDSASENRRHLSREFDEEKVTVKTVERAAVTNTASLAQSQELPMPATSFQLLFCRAEPNLALALQIPALARPVMQEAEAKLLQNILRWLGASLPQDTSYLNFRWPLPGLPAGDALLAGRSLAVFLQQAAAPHALQRLLLLGQGPAQCLELAGQERGLAFSYWASHSLSEMLAMPALKRDVWRQLQPLRAAL